MMADGGFAIGYHQSPLTGDDFEVMARRFSANGDAKANEFQMNTYTESFQQYVRITAGPAGFFAVWQSRGQDGSGFGVYGRSFDAVFGEDTQEFMLSETGEGFQEYAAVAAGGDGRFVVVWHQMDSYGNFEIKSRVHMPPVAPSL
ncbi:MAG: hypothetical protein ABI333_15600 [bacterium]